MSIIEREQTTLPDFETWPTVEEEKPKEGTIAYEALRLDRLFPGWANHVDLNTLDMPSPTHCVLGQGAYYTYSTFFGLIKSTKKLCWGDALDVVEDDAYRRSEMVASGAYASRFRAAEWVTEIEKRRAA